MFLTARQIRRAKQARELYHAMKAPTLQDLKPMICINLIKNNVVMMADVNLGEKVFGPDIGMIKG
jgi:hypothetical protein